MSSINGVLPIDKPAGPTSHDIVARARRALGVRRIGHTGTLDPFASGLLLLCIGPSTRLAEYLSAQSKSYSARMILGVSTDTDDLQGTPIARSEAWRDLTTDQLIGAFAQQKGELEQIPPQYSAKKIDGERMYDIARRGDSVELVAARVTVHDLRITRVELPEVDFEVDCSTGTYIRSIARDVGALLGVGGHLVSLRRTRIGTVRVEDALPLDELTDVSAGVSRLIAPAAAVGEMPTAELDAAQTAAIRMGKSIDIAVKAPEATPVALIGIDRDLIGIGERIGARLQPRKVFSE
jgi:tRNA pseudouridine55 synthase